MGKCIAIATWKFGKAAVARAGELLGAGKDAMDAVEKGVNVAELDADVVSVGYGGMPNAVGVMEMDAAIMNGRTHAVGSVAALKGCRTPISVARAVLENSRHPMLVGDGARRFANEHGFAEEEMLAEKAAEKHQRWLEDENAKPEFIHDTIGLLAMDERGEIVAGCSTSGMAFKYPGRVGDSPLIGGGLYADIEAGAGAATGNGDEILKFCMSFQVVEYMRMKCGAQEACQKVMRRYAQMNTTKQDADISLIALSANGEYGAATLRAEFPFSIWDLSGSRCETDVKC